MEANGRAQNVNLLRQVRLMVVAVVAEPITKAVAEAAGVQHFLADMEIQQIPAFLELQQVAVAGAQDISQAVPAEVAAAARAGAAGALILIL